MVLWVVTCCSSPNDLGIGTAILLSLSKPPASHLSILCATGDSGRAAASDSVGLSSSVNPGITTLLSGPASSGECCCLLSSGMSPKEEHLPTCVASAVPGTLNPSKSEGHEPHTAVLVLVWQIRALLISAAAEKLSLTVRFVRGWSTIHATSAPSVLLAVWLLPHEALLTPLQQVLLHDTRSMFWSSKRQLVSALTVIDASDAARVALGPACHVASRDRPLVQWACSNSSATSRCCLAAARTPKSFAASPRAESAAETATCSKVLQELLVGEEGRRTLRPSNCAGCSNVLEIGLKEIILPLQSVLLQGDS